MVQVFRSRFTPGLKNGKDVHFQEGEIVTYKTRSGKIVIITIDSDLMQHDTGFLGYECIFPDNERCFAVAEGIIGWEGKM